MNTIINTHTFNSLKHNYFRSVSKYSTSEVKKNKTKYIY